MRGVRFDPDMGWVGLCEIEDGGCGKWLLLQHDMWMVERTVKRCRACERERHRVRQGTDAVRARLRERHAGYRKDKPDQYREYQKRYRERLEERLTPAEMEARRAARREYKRAYDARRQAARRAQESPAEKAEKAAKERERRMKMRQLIQSDEGQAA